MIPLEQTPHNLRLIMDDTQAKLLLLQLGLLEPLLAASRRPGVSEPRAEAVHYYDHPTHWIFGFYYHGYPVAADNGFAVRCYPKSGVSREQFLGIIRDEMRTFAPYAAEFFKREELDRPPPN